MSIRKITDLQNSIDKAINPFGDIMKQYDWINQIANISHRIPVQPAIIEFSKINDQFSKYGEAFQKIENITSAFIQANEFAERFKEINDLFKFSTYDLADAINDFEINDISADEEKTSVKEIILDETAKLKKIIFDIYLNNQNLYALNPREFEKMIAELLYNKGFEVELTKQTRDNGYDILALKYIDGFSPIKYLVECKKYREDRKVGVEIIRSFKEVISTENANKGIIVTTSYFTKDAIDKQNETPLLLDYKNKDEVIEWVNEYYTQKAIR